MVTFNRSNETLATEISRITEFSPKDRNTNSLHLSYSNTKAINDNEEIKIDKIYAKKLKKYDVSKAWIKIRNY